MSAYLFGNRHDEEFIYKVVSWEGFQEIGTYDYITDGSIEASIDTDLKVTGSFNFEGMEEPDVNNLLRVYYSFVDDFGERFKEPLGTFIINYSSLNAVDTLEGIKSSGSLNATSVLSVLQNVLVGTPYTVKRNTNAVYRAYEICRDNGLKVDMENSGYSLSRDYTFSSGSNYLEIVNLLLEAADYLPAYPDENGVVKMVSKNTYKNREYQEGETGLLPSNHLLPSGELYPIDGTEQVGFYFVNNNESIMMPEIQRTNEWQTTPNVVRLLYNLEDACLSAWAKNIDGSRASLNSRGNKEITHFEEVSDLGNGNKSQAIVDMAINKLKELSADVEYVQFKHAFVPIYIYDPVKIKYSDFLKGEDNINWLGNVDNMSITLSPSVETQTKVKRTLEEELTINYDYTVIRGGD